MGSSEPSPGTKPAAETNAIASAESAAPGSPVTPAEAAAEPAVKRSDRVLPALRPEIQEVVRLVETGAGEEVARAFVDSSNVPYDLALDEIILLRDIGVPDGVIAGMMRRGAELRAQEAESASLKTNLVAAVEQLKEAMDRPETSSETPPGEPTVASAASGESAPPPAPVTTAQPPAEAPVAVQQFYTDLTPYGNWYQVPSYGWVWQPSVVVVNQTWAPYCQGGRWVWTNHGWYWNSDYSWGWAPFHYGRWCTYPGIGWCWVPDTVWGPSWVTWRHSGSHVGWAPLPPACGWRSGLGLTWHGEGVSVGFGFGLSYASFTFVEYGSFCHRNVGHRAIRGGRAEHIYNNTTVVNNVINGDNNTIVNNGVGYSNVASLTRGEVPKARVEPLPGESTSVARADRMERSKDGYVVYRPTAVESAGGRPAAVRSEVRPSSSTAGIVGNERPSRSSVANPSRPSVQSRFATGGNDAPGKAAEDRSGSGLATQTSPRPSSSVARPSSPASRPMAPTTRGTASRTGTLGTGTDGKPVESRGGSTVDSTGRSSVVTTPGAGRSLNNNGRATTPVPLGDPSRNLPSRTRESSARTVVPVNPGKSTFESRGGYSSPAVGAPATTERPSSSTAVPNRYVPQQAGGMGPNARGLSTPGAPKVDYQRGSSMGAAGGGAASSFNAPRPSVSTPSPQFSAPRPSYTAPSPTMSRPSPVSTPSMSAPAPRAPQAGGASPSGRSGSNRSNPN